MSTEEQWILGSAQDSNCDLISRMKALHNSSRMSDLCVLAVDENWWFGDTVKDFDAHKLLLGSASPVLEHALYKLDVSSNPNRVLRLDANLEVVLSTRTCVEYEKLEIEGVPPIAIEAVLDYIYNDNFPSESFANGYSRNLLWRLWHASKAFEMIHLQSLCESTIRSTMCQETIFFDLNYAMKYEGLDTKQVLELVLNIVDGMNEQLYLSSNFVWLHHDAIELILKRRKRATSDPVVIYDNLLRWSIYQVDRNAFASEDAEETQSVGLKERLSWIGSTLNNSDEFKQSEVLKYLRRGLQYMPWTELSQKAFLDFVVPFPQVLERGREQLLELSIDIMGIVVDEPSRLTLHSCHSEDASGPEDIGDHKETNKKDVLDAKHSHHERSLGIK